MSCRQPKLEARSCPLLDHPRPRQLRLHRNPLLHAQALQRLVQHSLLDPLAATSVPLLARIADTIGGSVFRTIRAACAFRSVLDFSNSATRSCSCRVASLFAAHGSPVHTMIARPPPPQSGPLSRSALPAAHPAAPTRDPTIQPHSPAAPPSPSTAAPFLHSCLFLLLNSRTLARKPL